MINPPKGYYVQHCGHPTALWPWTVETADMTLIAPNGTAFQYKGDAEAAARLHAAGRMPTYPHRSQPRFTCCGKGPDHILETWELIGNENNTRFHAMRPTT